MFWFYSSNQSSDQSETLDFDRSWSELMHITCSTLWGHPVKGDNSFCKFGHVPDLENYPSDLDETRLIRKLVQFPETLQKQLFVSDQYQTSHAHIYQKLPTFHSFAAQFCSSPANPPGRPTGLKIGTRAGLDLNWPLKKSRFSPSSRIWDTVAQYCPGVSKFPEPDFRSYFNMS